MARHVEPMYRIILLVLLTGSLMRPSGCVAADPLAGKRLYQAECAGCHAPDGSGGGEGGVAVPAIGAAALRHPRVTPPARPAYDTSSLARAVTAGIDPNGRLLTPPMARFPLSIAELCDLEAYLGIIGSAGDPEPGVDPAEIRIGSVLPLSGPGAPAGRAIQLAIEAEFAAAGPIYGRRLRLDAGDAGENPAAAIGRLTQGGQVLALIASLLPASSKIDLPVVGPLAEAATEAQQSFVFSLQAPSADLLARAAAAVLIEGLKRAGARPSRVRLIAAMETLQDFQVNGMPPLSFGRGRHTWNTGQPRAPARRHGGSPQAHPHCAPAQ